MTKEEAKSCINTIEMLQRLAYNIHGVMDVIDADNCKKIIKALEQEPKENTWSIKEVANALERHGLLEQEPCGDAISRQTAIDAFEKFIHEFGIEDKPYNYGEKERSDKE